MSPEAQINFYLSERWPKTLFVVTKNGDKKLVDIDGFHYMYISWRRIYALYHPRKFPIDGELRGRAAHLCKAAIEYALSKTKKGEEAEELKAAYKSVINAALKERKSPEIPG